LWCILLSSGEAIEREVGARRRRKLHNEVITSICEEILGSRRKRGREITWLQKAHRERIDSRKMKTDSSAHDFLL
jgi:hypothetical protein